jgi:hypothetical protein
MKGEKLYLLRREILDSMSFVLLCAPDEFPPECKTDLARKRQEMTSQLAEHRHSLRSREQLIWHNLAEQESTAAFEAFATGDRKLGASLLQQAEEHFRRSFRPKRIRPGFVVGLDGQAAKT